MTERNHSDNLELPKLDPYAIVIDWLPESMFCNKLPFGPDELGVFNRLVILKLMRSNF